MIFSFATAIDRGFNWCTGDQCLLSIHKDDLGKSALAYAEINLVCHSSEAREIILAGSAMLSALNSGLEQDPMVTSRLVSGPFSNNFGTVQLSIAPQSVLGQSKIYLLGTDERFPGGSVVRILVCDRAVPSMEQKALDPSKFGGPIYCDGDWFLINNARYEFLVTFPIALSEFSRLGFVNHNSSSYCLRYGDFCRQRDMDQAICELVAMAITRRDPVLVKLMKDSRLIVHSELLVPIGLWLKALERRSLAVEEELPESEISEGFLRLSMGDVQGAVSIFQGTTRDSINKYITRELSRLLEQPVASLYLE